LSAFYGCCLKIIHTYYTVEMSNLHKYALLFLYKLGPSTLTFIVLGVKKAPRQMSHIFLCPTTNLGESITASSKAVILTMTDNQK